MLKMWSLFLYYINDDISTGRWKLNNEKLYVVVDTVNDIAFNHQEWPHKCDPL
jgi:hypothetical protein